MHAPDPFWDWDCGGLRSLGDQWTSSGRLRHPRFLGLREDKSPRDVVRE